MGRKSLDYWEFRSRTWEVKEPLTPTDKEVDLFLKFKSSPEEFSLILGATQSLAQAFPKADVIDHSPSMLSLISTEGSKIDADWLDYDYQNAGKHYDLIIGDGSLSTLHTDYYEIFFRKMYEACAARGFLVIRIYDPYDLIRQQHLLPRDFRRVISSMKGDSYDADLGRVYPGFDGAHYSFPPVSHVLECAAGWFDLVHCYASSLHGGVNFPILVWQKP